MGYEEAINKIIDIIDPDESIDHFDLEDAMDCLYEICSILRKVRR